MALENCCRRRRIAASILPVFEIPIKESRVRRVPHLSFMLCSNDDVIPWWFRLYNDCRGEGRLGPSKAAFRDPCLAHAVLYDLISGK